MNTTETTQNTAAHAAVLALIAKLPRQNQRQDSTNEQVSDLEAFAERLGLDVAVLAIEDDSSYVLSKRLQSILDAVEQQPKSVLSANSNFGLLRQLGNKLGLYDASDLVASRQRLASKPY
jgi:hypothetical protein